MKKILSVLLLCLILTTSVFALNNQKVFSVEDDVYKQIKSIYILTGHALPSTTGPWSADELIKMLDKIPESEIPEEIKNVYEKAYSTLEAEPEHEWGGIAANFNNEFNLQIASHTNKDSQYSRVDYATAISGAGINKILSESEYQLERLFWGRQNWASKYVKQNVPIYNLDFETFVGQHIYTDFNFGFYNSEHGRTLGNDEYPINEWGSFGVMNNIFSFQNFKFDVSFMDANFPYRGFLSVGGNNWNVQIGRDKVSWGAGTTGNMTISNNMPFQNILRFTTYSNKFKYTFMTSFFAHPQDYYNNGVYTLKTGQDGVDGISMYLAHRVEGRFFNDKLNGSLTEAIMYESATNHLDLAILNPFFIYHNLYTPDIANSTLCLELDYTVFKGLNFYGQGLVDEFAIPLIEESAGPDKSDTSNRYGFLLGANYVSSMLDGIFTTNVEFAKIDPYTYLRKNSQSDNYGLDYAVAVRQWSTACQSVTWDEYWQGYTYGPDSKVFNINLDFAKGDFDISINFLSASKGTHDQWTIAGDTGGEGEEAWQANSTTCTTNHETGNRRYGVLNTDAATNAYIVGLLAENGYTYQSYKDRNAVQKTYDFGISASYKLMDGKLKIYGQADWILINNAYNIKDQNDSDFQLVLGAKYCY